MRNFLQLKFLSYLGIIDKLLVHSIRRNNVITIVVLLILHNLFVDSSLHLFVFVVLGGRRLIFQRKVFYRWSIKNNRDIDSFKIKE